MYNNHQSYLLEQHSESFKHLVRARHKVTTNTNNKILYTPHCSSNRLTSCSMFSTWTLT